MKAVPTAIQIEERDCPFSAIIVIFALLHSMDADLRLTAIMGATAGWWQNRKFQL
jgi:hypothetical protein